MRETKVTEGMLETLMNEAVNRIPELSKAMVASKGSRKGQLLTGRSKKWDGLTAYVWRMCRFHTGADLTMPVVCQFDLMDWVNAHGDHWSWCGEPFTTLIDRLDKEVVDPVIMSFGGNPYIAAQRWGRALGFSG